MEDKDDIKEVRVVNQNRGRKLIAHQELRPKFLGKDVDLSWIIDFKSYINTGYNGEVPKKNLYRQLRPLLHEFLKSSMDDLEQEKQNFNQLCEAQLEEGKLHMPHHQRQINLLKAKKGSGESHSDIKDRLDKLISGAELDKMTKDKWEIHPFAENANQQIVKVSMEWSS